MRKTTGLSATNLQVTTTKDGGMGDSFSNMLMGYMSQSGEDGTMGILRAINDPEAKSGDFFGPLGLTGEAKILPPGPEEKFADVKS
jgi:hypothetical protein